MKIRTDFVTNSSSSSFVLKLKIELENGESIEWNGQGSLEDGYVVTANKSPKELGRATDINQLIDLIKNSIQNHVGIEPDRFEKIIDDESKIIKELKNITSIDEIKSITIEGYEDTMYDDYARDEIITYDMKNKKLNSKVYGVNDMLECEGSSGELLFDTNCEEQETEEGYFDNKRNEYFNSGFKYDYPSYFFDDEE